MRGEVQASPPRRETFERLAAELEAAFGEGVEAPWSEERFERLALRVFAFQFAASPLYRRFCVARGATPETVPSWTAVPAVPAAAFKHLPLVAGAGPDQVERVFRTSGTTRAGRSGEHHVRSLALYRASLLPAFRAALLPDGARLLFLSLVPSPSAQPSSSLSTMVGAAAEAFGAGGSGWFAESPEGLDVEALTRALRSAERAGTPVLLLGTAFAFVHWLDGDRGPAFRLPAGSRLMETGGFKGRSRMVERPALYGALSERLGIGVEWMVGEYGMTELLSQYYERGIGASPAGGAVSLARALSLRRLVPPPWLRFSVLDPSTLEPLDDGRPGLLQHFDLANLGSVAAVLTEDVGIRDGAGLELMGRTPGAEPRGCSLAVEELLASAEATRAR